MVISNKVIKNNNKIAGERKKIFFSAFILISCNKKNVYCYLSNTDSCFVILGGGFALVSNSAR